MMGRPGAPCAALIAKRSADLTNRAELGSSDPVKRTSNTKVGSLLDFEYAQSLLRFT